jgi:hypothetical protein
MATPSDSENVQELTRMREALLLQLLESTSNQEGKWF